MPITSETQQLLAQMQLHNLETSVQIIRLESAYQQPGLDEEQKRKILTAIISLKNLRDTHLL
jgi:hypothetical protein